MQTPDQTSPLREAHLRDYWKVVWQGRWTIVTVFVAVLGLTAGWTFLQAPLYKSTAIIEIQPQARRVLAGGDMSGLGAAGFGWFAEEKYHNTQVEIIKSRDIAQRVVRTLGLENHPMFENHPDPALLFRKMVRVDPRRDTGLLEISITGNDPDEITRWVNEVAHAYVRRNFEKAQENVQGSVDAIRNQMKELTVQLTTAEENRFGTLLEDEIFDSENQEEIVRQKLQTLTSDLTAVNFKRSQLAETIRQIGRMQKDGSDLLAIPALAEDPTLQELNRSKVELERKLESAKVSLRPGHPEYEETLGELTTVEQRLDGKIQLIVNSLTAQYNAVVSQAEYLQDQIRDTETDSLELAKATSRYDINQAESDTKRQIFDLIAKTFNEIQLNMQMMSNNVTVLDEAVPPLFSIKPRKKINLFIGAMMGLMLGIGTIFFMDYLDNTIRSPEDVEKYLGVSVLSVVPRMQHGQGLAERAIKEAFQSLRTSIIFSSKNRQRKVILITSTGPREGKSSTIANLARTLAAAGDRVIILDCDLRRPKQHVHFGLERDPGLTNYLAAPEEEKDWQPYVKTIGPANLQLMTCGPIPPSPPELLSNRRFAELLESMREAYEWILIDSPPAASLADAALLASWADMIVPVVQHNTTDRDHVVKTIQGLRAVNPEIAGVVLNNVNLDRAYHKDYYYANYYYSEDEKAPRTKRRLEGKTKVG